MCIRDSPHSDFVKNITNYYEQQGKLHECVLYVCPLEKVNLLVQEKLKFDFEHKSVMLSLIHIFRG